MLPLQLPHHRRHDDNIAWGLIAMENDPPSALMRIGVARVRILRDIVTTAGASHNVRLRSLDRTNPVNVALSNPAFRAPAAEAVQHLAQMGAIRTPLRGGRRVVDASKQPFQHDVKRLWFAGRTVDPLAFTVSAKARVKLDHAHGNADVLAGCLVAVDRSVPAFEVLHASITVTSSVGVPGLAPGQGVALMLSSQQFTKSEQSV